MYFYRNFYLISDIMMPEMDGFEVLAMMKKCHWIDDIPVIMISAENASSFVERAYDLGASDYISRPFDTAVVRRRVINTLMLSAKQKRLVQLVAEQVYEKEKSNSTMINILSHIVEFRNGESGLHVLHIQTATEILLHTLVQQTDRYKLTSADISLISTASALHDIGKINIPESILNKPGKLTKEEFDTMKTHTTIGAEILDKLPFQQESDLVKTAYAICRWHHERYDGRGYPDGLSGHDIPPGSRVIAVADSIDAMMSSRSYRAAMTGAACRCEIEKNSGIMYDPRVASAALAHWDTLISRYAADTPRIPYFDRLMLERTRQAHDYLVAHQDSRITLAELAAKFHLSQSSLKLSFKALYGVPVAGYLRTVRMDTAARLLQESDLPVAEIAHRVGYEDPSRFSAAFRRHTGRRPTELRRVACPCAE